MYLLNYVPTTINVLIHASSFSCVLRCIAASALLVTPPLRAAAFAYEIPDRTSLNTSACLGGGHNLGYGGDLYL